MTAPKHLHSAYCGEHGSSDDTSALTPADCALAEEAHQLALGSPLTSAPRLAAAVDAITPSAPDLAGFKSTYAKKVKVAETHKIYFLRFTSGGLEPMLDRGYADLMALDDEQVAKWSKRFYDIAVLLADGTAIDTTPQGLPSLWFRDDSAVDIMELAMVVSMRGFTFCDNAHLDVWSDVSPEQRLVAWSKTMVVFIEEFFAHGHREASTQLSLEFSQEENSPRDPTMLAKRRHGLAFFSPADLNMDILAGGFVMATWLGGRNATVQTQITNFMFSNYHGSALATIIFDSLPMAAKGSRNFAAAGVLEGYDASFVEPIAANLEAADVSIREELLQEVRSNSVEEWEA